MEQEFLKGSIVKQQDTVLDINVDDSPQRECQQLEYETPDIDTVNPVDHHVEIVSRGDDSVDSAEHEVDVEGRHANPTEIEKGEYTELAEDNHKEIDTLEKLMTTINDMASDIKSLF